LHVDLDGGADVFAVHGWRYDLAGDPMFASGLANALDFLDAERVRATFFVIARDLDVPAKRELLDEIVRRGHDVASHSVTHRHLTRLPSDEKRREIADSRARIEAELGVPVEGFRASGFDIDRESLELVADAGYRWDSSLFPNAYFARRAGLAELADRPSRPLEGRDLVELPLPAHAPLPVPFHPSYSLVLGLPWFRLGLARFERRRAPLVLLFHLTDFADPLPTAALPGLRGRVFTLSFRSAETKRRRCAAMLARVRRGFTIGRTADLLDA
jgi:peptidoglycan/xylan/chitin deacetylase (PgdA/CDA1 family)